MNQDNQKICALYGCDKPVTNWRLSCCCRSHQNQYAAKKRHNTVDKPSKTKEDWLEWQKKYNKELYYSNGYKRRDLKLLTPKWANLLIIDQLYVQARRLYEETGIAYEVDHIIPLTHNLVCGLHVENNLQLLPANENARKSNKFFME